MCNSASPPSFSEPSSDKASSLSRRRRLWELPQHCHCPVIGTCVPLRPLRKLLNKAIGEQMEADDYDLHTGAVSACDTRNRISELLQRDLEQRYALTIGHFKAAKTVESLARLWNEAIAAGDVAGAFWAGLTHPQCNPGLQECMCRDMHMLQHQAGANARADLGRFNAIVEENHVLARELGRAQERTTRLLAEKAEEIRRINASLMRLRADGITKDTLIACLRADLADLQNAVPGLQSRIQLMQQTAKLEERIRELEQQNAALRQQCVQAAAAKPISIERTIPEEKPQTAPVRLTEKTILCVGGRNGNVTAYRRMIERVGGQFAHHDGGREDNLHQLDASLAAADLVICQTGCISHNAYWRVKDYCKRTGKRCMFVENPSLSSLSKGLEQLSVVDVDDSAN